MMPWVFRLRAAISCLAKRIDTGLVIASLLTLFASQALLQPGLPTSADLAIHLHRTAEFERAWAPGVIVPRWAPNLAFGYGYPLFVFAPPLPYLLALIFDRAGLTLESAFKLLLILTLTLYAAGMYLLGRDLFRSKAAGMVAATAYAFAPFALREGLLSGGNVPQLLAIGLFPWPLWAVTRAGRGRSAWGWTLLAALFYSGIMLSHLFQVFVYTPVLFFYSLLQLALTIFRVPQQGEEGRSLGWLRLPALVPLLAVPLGLLLSAFFWLPAFTERYFTRAQAEIYLEKSPFFIRYPYWPELVAWIYPLDSRAANPYTPLTLGVVTLVLAGLGLLAGTLGQIAPSSPAKEKSASCRAKLSARVIFFAVVAGGASLMTLPLSRPVWEQVAILQVAEFPWRMLGLANLGLAVLAGAAILIVPGRWRGWAAAGWVVIQLGAVAPLLYPVTGFTRYGDLSLRDQIRYEQSSQSIGTTTLGEYLPQTVRQTPTGSPLVEIFRAGQVPERLDRERLPPAAEATLLEQTAVTHRYQLKTAAPFTLRLLQFAYPGWRADLDGQPAEIVPEAGTGLMLIDIPAGEHRLTVHFGETPGRIIAMSLSGLALLGLIGVILVRYRRRFIPGQIEEVGDLPAGNGGLNLKGWPFWGISLLIIVTALGLKPLLRPLFNLDSPRERVLPAQYPAEVQFENGIRLVGYDLARRVIRPGSTIQVVLYWQTEDSEAISRLNLQPFVHLDRLNDFVTVAGSTNYTPGDVTTETVLPTFHWDNERYIRDEHDLTIPPGTAPLAYALRVGMIDPEQGGKPIALAGGAGDTAWLDTVNLKPLQAPPPLSQPLAVAFGNETDMIYLTGFELTGLTASQLSFTLAWRSDERPEADYTVFVQLLDEAQRQVAGFDRPPLDGAYPTSTWLPGQSIHDPRLLPLEGVAPGQYRLIAGLYDPLTGQRLVTGTGADFIELTTVTLNKE